MNVSFDQISYAIRDFFEPEVVRVAEKVIDLTIEEVAIMSIAFSLRKTAQDFYEARAALRRAEHER